MNLTLLKSENNQVVEIYVLKKFKSFRNLDDAKRTQKIQQYYEAVRYKEMNSSVVLAVHRSIYGSELDTRLKGPVDWHLDIIRRDIEELETWEKNQKWQEGEDFLNKLKVFMNRYDGEACDTRYFKSEFAAETKKAATGTGILNSREIGGEFDAVLGMQQESKLSFEAITDFGEFTAKLEQSLKGGAWAHGKAHAKMKAAGFNAEMEFMAAIGGELTIDGMMGWKKGEIGLELGGKVQAFAGARINVAAKLSAEARKNFAVSIEAGCFVGFEIECRGKGAFIYGEKEVMSGEAAFKFKAGIGAEFEASFSTQVFGPTKIKVATGAAFIVGGGLAASISIDFPEMHVLAKDGFRTLLYLPTLADGWKMELMTQDTRNRYYLKRCQKIVQDECDAVQAVMNSSERRGYVKLL